MQMSQDDFKAISDSTGIPALRSKLETSLIANYRKLKIEDIVKSYTRCRKQILAMSQNAIQQQENAIELAKAGAEALKKRIDSMAAEKEELLKENKDLKKAVERLENSIKSRIRDLERKEN